MKIQWLYSIIRVLGGIPSSKEKGALRFCPQCKTLIEIGWDKKMISNGRDEIVSGKVSSRVLARKFQTDWYKMPFLEEADTENRLGIKCQ